MIAFLAMVETYLEGWDRASSITRINETLYMLEWRFSLARGNKGAVLASQEVNYQPGESKTSFSVS